MENIGNFLAVCEDLGVNKLDLFQTVDLYEAENLPQVRNFEGFFNNFFRLLAHSTEKRGTVSEHFGCNKYTRKQLQ